MDGHLRIIRPANLMITASALGLSYVLAGAEKSFIRFGLSSLSVLLLVAGFYIINDLSDRKIDRVSHPSRPLPAGDIGRAEARRLSVLLFLGAAMLGALSGAAPFFALLVWAATLTFYERGLKQTGLPANVLVSLTISSVLLFGAWLGGDWKMGIPPAIFAFLLHFGRELVKDMADMDGDRKGGRKTYPMEAGIEGARTLTAAILTAVILFSPIPFFLDLFNMIYLILILVLVDLVLVVGLVFYLGNPDRLNLARMSRLLKGEMWIGMAAMLLGRN